ncbi:hypothetical protein [Nocardia ninae]|uniref:hypothetical protein n=1 Tax=Nocardia ninae TaxID=356145 RepID=UPI0031D4E0FD
MPTVVMSVPATHVLVVTISVTAAVTLIVALMLRVVQVIVFGSGCSIRIMSVRG